MTTATSNANTQLAQQEVINLIKHLILHYKEEMEPRQNNSYIKGND